MTKERWIHTLYNGKVETATITFDGLEYRVDSADEPGLFNTYKSYTWAKKSLERYGFELADTEIILGGNDDDKLTNTEIKRAFEEFKRELKKETGIAYGFTMNKRQIEKRTATYTVESSTTTYDDNIAVARLWDERVQAYDSWTDEEKARSHAEAMERIERIKARKEKYGTKANEVKATKEAIKNSKAFKKFEETVGKTMLTTEIDSEGFYKIRFSY